ncbi:unnamed protein product, partial [Meganyctiphanes norvegica]
DITKCKELVEYFRKTWLHTTLFCKEHWCWFKQSIRTNNDVEGWHTKLNRKGAKLRLYDLIMVLGREANDVHTTVELVRHERLSRKQTFKTKACEKAINEFW